MILALALSVVSPSLAQEAPPVVNGSTTSDYEAIGVLLACSRSGCSSFCSGNLVDSNWVVTAAHCVEALDEYVRYGYDGYFGVGPDVGSLTDYQLISSYAEHPSYNASSLRNDIGMVELDAGGITSVSPVAMNTDSINSSWVGTDLRYVGYGITGDGRGGSGTKRFGDIPIYDYDSYFVVSYDGRVNVCQGDSGGAGLLMSGSSYTLVAVNSYVTPSCDGGATGGTRVDQYISWIDGYVSSTGGSTGGSSSGGSSDGGGDSGSSGGSSGGSSSGGDSGSSGGSSGGSSSGSGSDGGSGTGGEGGDGTVDDPALDTGAPRGFGEVEATSDVGGGCATGALPASGGLAVLAGLVGLARRRDD